jgi:hypothetical protein
MMLVSVMTYIDRNTLALLAPMVAVATWTPASMSYAFAIGFRRFGGCPRDSRIWGRRNLSGLTAGSGAGSWSALVAVVMPGFGRPSDLPLYGAASLAASLGPAAGYLIWWILSRREAAIKRESALVI